MPDGDDEADRARLLWSQAEYGPDEISLAEIRSLAESEDAEARKYAVLALDRMYHYHTDSLSAIVTTLVRRVGDESPEVRAEALSTLGWLGKFHPEEVRGLASDTVPRLVDVDEQVRERAPWAVASVAAAAPESVLPAAEQLFAQLFERQSDHAAVALIQLARSSSDVRSRLIALLDREWAGCPALCKGFEEVAFDRPEVLEGLVPRFVSFLDTEDPDLRNEAIVVVVRAADAYPDDVAPAVPRLVDLLEDDESSDKAAWALQFVARHHRKSASEAIPTLIEQLESGNGRVAALAEIARNSPEAIRPAKEQLLSMLSESSSDTSGVDDALGSLATVDPDVRAQLLDELDADSWVRISQALDALSVVAAERPETLVDSLPAVTERLVAERWGIRRGASAIIAEVAREYPDAGRVADDVLRRRLHREDHQDVLADVVRAVANRILGGIDLASEDIDRLVTLLEWDVGDVAGTAAVAVGYVDRFDDRTVTTDPDRVRSLVAELLDYPTTTNALHRREAAVALGVFGTSREVPGLSEAADADPDPNVREAARQSLDRLSDRS